MNVNAFIQTEGSTRSLVTGLQSKRHSQLRVADSKDKITVGSDKPDRRTLSNVFSRRSTQPASSGNYTVSSRHKREVVQNLMSRVLQQKKEVEPMKAPSNRIPVAFTTMSKAKDVRIRSLTASKRYR